MKMYLRQSYFSDNLFYSVLQKNDNEAVFVSYDARSFDHAIRLISFILIFDLFYF